MRKLLEEYLKIQPLARERKNKNRTIGNLIIKTYNLEISREKMEGIVSDILTGDRAWRQILEQRPELRGSDYGDKDELEQKKQIELGYEPGATEKLPI